MRVESCLTTAARIMTAGADIAIILPLENNTVAVYGYVDPTLPLLLSTGPRTRAAVAIALAAHAHESLN